MENVMQITKDQIHIIGCTFDDIRDVEYTLKKQFGSDVRVYAYGTGMMRIDLDGISIFAQYQYLQNGIKIIDTEQL